MNKRYFAALFVMCLSLFPLTSVIAAEYAVGDQLPPFTLADQFDNSVALNNKVSLLIFTRSMAGGKVVREALEGATTEQMQQAGIAYVADISGMPSLIAKLVAVPKMKDFGFKVLLDREGDATKLLPAAADTAAVISLEQLKITQIRYFDTADSLKQALQSAGLK